MKESRTVSDEMMVEGIRNGDRNALRALYEKHWPMVLHLITTNSGNEDEAKDVYQEAVIVLYENIRNGDFELVAKLKTYLYAVSRRLWLKQLRTKGRFVGEVKDHQHFEVWEPQLDGDEKRNYQQKVVADCMADLGQPCQSILTDFFYGGYTMEEIADKMGYTNAANAKNQKYKCFQRLKKAVLARLKS